MLLDQGVPDAASVIGSTCYALRLLWNVDNNCGRLRQLLPLFRFSGRCRLQCSSFAGMCSRLAGIGTIWLFLVFTQIMVLQDGTL